MNRAILTAALLSLPLAANAEPASRAECVLQWMPGVMNDVVAEAVVKHCEATLVGSRYNAKPRQPGEGGIADAFECVHRHAAATPSEEAAEAIAEACRELYPRRGSSW